MPDTETRRMTTDEIALVREIARWRRNHDIEFFRHRRMGRFMEWSNRRTQLSVAKDIGVAEISHGARYGTHDRIDVATVAQAVDILVALGYLPARFSSAYRAGWDASRVWHDGFDAVAAEDQADFKRLFHDPLNVSFPATPERGRP